MSLRKFESLLFFPDIKSQATKDQNTAIMFSIWTIYSRLFYFLGDNVSILYGIP